jgi:hypothetical protein
MLVERAAVRQTVLKMEIPHALKVTYVSETWHTETGQHGDVAKAGDQQEAEKAEDQ